MAGDAVDEARSILSGDPDRLRAFLMTHPRVYDIALQQIADQSIGGGFRVFDDVSRLWNITVELQFYRDYLGTNVVKVEEATDANG